MKYIIISSDTNLLKIKELWKEYNKKFFGNKLQDIDINWMKENKRVRSLGYINIRKRILVLNKRLLRNEAILERTLLHEMCHQAVIDIDKDLKCRHGIPWIRWMQKCGLKPNVTNEADEILNENDKKVIEDDRKLKESKVLKPTSRQTQSSDTKLNDDPYFQKIEKFYNQFIPGVSVTLKRKIPGLKPTTYYGIIVLREQKNYQVDRCLIVTTETPSTSFLTPATVESVTLANPKIEKKIKQVLTDARIKEILKKEYSLFSLYKSRFDNCIEYK